jgi:hypothetical protein
MNYGELQKSYPEFKIPVLAHAEYYIDTLVRAEYVNTRPIELLKTLEANQDLYLKKREFINATLDFFTQQGWTFTAASNDTTPLTLKAAEYNLLEFSSFKEDKLYVSIDLKAANWQAFQYYFNLNLSDWEVWLIDSGLRPHSFYAESKSIRQLIFGNTNPKRLQTIQRGMMQTLIDNLSTFYKNKIVSRTSDEIIIELSTIEEAYGIQFYVNATPFKFKTSFFKMQKVTNFNETVNLKTTISSEGKELSKRIVNVPGNRFYIHLKTLLMNEDVDKRDLLFEHDKKLAQWVIE